MFSFIFSPRKFKRAKKAKKTANADQPDAVPDQANLAPDPRDEIIRKLEAELKKKQGEVKKQKINLQRKDRKIKRLEHKAKNPSKAILQKEMVLFLEQAGIPKSQVHCLVYKKKFTWYKNDPEGLARAAVQYAISPGLYNHLQKLHGALKLPHRTTLAEHYKHFQVTKGFQTDAINILEKMRQTTDKKFYEHALIAFDEVAIKGDEVEMDKRTQEVLGPHSKMQVVSIRGLGPK